MNIVGHVCMQYAVWCDVCAVFGFVDVHGKNIHIFFVEISFFFISFISAIKTRVHEEVFV